MKSSKFFWVSILACLFGCSDDSNSNVNSTLETIFNSVRDSTSAYLILDAAVTAGYADIQVVVPNMGHHYLNSAYMDGNFEATHPEILVYAPMADSTNFQLVAVEYAVPIDLSPDGPPAGFPGDLDEWDRNEQFGLWTLHAWVWLPNPDGVFADTNPFVP